MEPIEVKTQNFVTIFGKKYQVGDKVNCTCDYVVKRLVYRNSAITGEVLPDHQTVVYVNIGGHDCVLHSKRDERWILTTGILTKVGAFLA